MAAASASTSPGSATGSRPTSSASTAPATSSRARADEATDFEIGGHGRSVPQLLGAVYAAGRLHETARPAVFAAIRKAARWEGALDRQLIDHLSDPTSAPPLSWRRFPTDERWALQVLGFGPEATPTPTEISRRFRSLLRESHPDHGAESEGAGQRILELTEARRILMACGRDRRPGCPAGPGASATRDHPRSSPSRRRWRRTGCRSSASTSRPARPTADGAGDLVRDEAAALAERTGLAPDRLVLGGRSMGGRMCSMAVADGLPALGLVLVSYPLHPPGPAREGPHRALPPAVRAVPVRVGHPGRVRHARRAGGGHRRHPRAGHPRVDRRRRPRAAGTRPAGGRRGQGLGGGLPAGAAVLGVELLQLPARRLGVGDEHEDGQQEGPGGQHGHGRAEPCRSGRTGRRPA